MSEYEEHEAISKSAVLSQWDRSLKRKDLSERDRVIGAIEAYKRQWFALTQMPSKAPDTHKVNG